MNAYLYIRISLQRFVGSLSSNSAIVLNSFLVYVQLLFPIRKSVLVFYTLGGIGDVLHDLAFLRAFILLNPRFTVHLFTTKRVYEATRCLAPLFKGITVSYKYLVPLFAIDLWRDAYGEATKLRLRNLDKISNFEDVLMIPYRALPLFMRKSVSHPSELVPFFSSTISDICISANRSFLVLNSVPISDHSTMIDLKFVEQIALELSLNNNVFLSSPPASLAPSGSSCTILNSSLFDYAIDSYPYTCIIGIASGPAWVAMRSSIRCLFVCRHEDLSPIGNNVYSFRDGESLYRYCTQEFLPSS